MSIEFLLITFYEAYKACETQIIDKFWHIKKVPRVSALV